MPPHSFSSRKPFLSLPPPASLPHGPSPGPSPGSSAMGVCVGGVKGVVCVCVVV